jgi:hypothetical protein
MKPRIAVLGLLVYFAGCGSSHQPGAPEAIATETPKAPSPSPSPSGTTVSAPSFKVDLTVNGSKQGVFSCSGPLFVTTSVTNFSTDPLRLERLTVDFVPPLITPYCVPHAAGIDPSLPTTVLPGATVAVRTFDAAGGLCQGPIDSGSCNWTAVAEVAGQGASMRDQIAFVVQQVALDVQLKDPGCATDIPRVVTPLDGQVLSGTIQVTATLVDSRFCVISARTNVQIFSEQGQLVRSVRNLDLGDHSSWDTRTVPNGRYGLTAEQNCCRVPSIPIYVTVRN